MQFIISQKIINISEVSFLENKMVRKLRKEPEQKETNNQFKMFHINFLNEIQEEAYKLFNKNQILFLIGPSGVGKSLLAMMFAIDSLLKKTTKKIYMTRPLVESGENLGFLKGDLDSKLGPHMTALYDVIDKLCSDGGAIREHVNRHYEVAPLAFMRGRAIINSENIITPSGLVPMGEIKLGDYVIGSNGKPTKVIGVYPQGKKPTYQVNFSDHTKSICSGDHLWSTMTLNEKLHKKGFSTKNTLDIMVNTRNKNNKKIHQIPIISNPVIFQEANVPIHPYLLGVLLSDISKNMSIISEDTEIIDNCIECLPSGYKIVYKGKYNYKIQSNRKNKIDLQSKSIPDIYKFNSVECRLSVLQGLLDADGLVYQHRSGTYKIKFSSKSKQLINDVMFLVRSLGGSAHKCTRDFDIRKMYVVDLTLPINPFKLNRKAYQYQPSKSTKMISSIVPKGAADCTCIKVEAEDHLFLTNDFILTHNTFDDAVCIFDEVQNSSAQQLKLFLTRMGNNCRMIITGDPLQSDIGRGSGLMDVFNKIKDIEGIAYVEFKREHIVRNNLIGKILEALEK